MTLKTKAFGDIITFTRASGGGRFNAQGQYEWLPANEPRIDYDPVTGECLGLLIEESRTRLNPVSTGSTLFPTRINATYIEDGTLYIDAVTPFRKLVEDTSTAAHYGFPAAVALAANTTYTVQYVVKAAGRTRFRMDAASAPYWRPSNPEVSYDLTAKTATGANGATGTITEIGAGVFLVTWTATTGASSFSSSAFPVLRNSAGDVIYTGDGVSGIYISGYNITAGSFGTSLIVGEGSQVTRAADIASVNDLSPWYNAEAGTFVIKHDAPAGRPLLSSGANVIAVSQGPGKLVVAYDAQGSYVSYNDSPYASGPALSIGAALDLFKSATSYMGARGQSVRYFPRKLNVSEGV